MRSLWDGRAFMLAMLFILAGCATEDHLKPPKPPECFNRPPSNEQETRFDNPPSLPRKLLMQDQQANGFDLATPDNAIRKNGVPTGGGMRGPGMN